MHIQDMLVKTADVLSQVQLEMDTYHQDIARGARAMVHAGLGSWTYQTKWSSGATAWMSADGDFRIVRRDEAE